MKQIALLSTLSVALLASFAAQAADTTELKVTGVIRPAACTPSFGAGGVVDYGTIPSKSLSATDFTILAEKTIPFMVTCDGDTKVSVQSTDNRSTSVLAGAAAKINSVYTDGYAFGLGTAGTKNIGAYTVRLIPASFTSTTTSNAAAGAVALIQSDNAGASWAAAVTTSALTKGRSQSFAAAGTTTPTAYKTISGNLAVQAVLNKSGELPVTSDILLDGSATIEVKYL